MGFVQTIGAVQGPPGPAGPAGASDIIDLSLGAAGGGMSTPFPSGMLMPRAATWRNGRCSIVSNTMDASTIVRVRKNGVDQLTVTIPAGSTTPITIPGTVSYAQDDIFSVIVDATASSSGGLTGVLSAELA